MPGGPYIFPMALNDLGPPCLQDSVARHLLEWGRARHQALTPATSQLSGPALGASQEKGEGLGLVVSVTQEVMSPRQILWYLGKTSRDPK